MHIKFKVTGYFFRKNDFFNGNYLSKNLITWKQILCIKIDSVLEGLCYAGKQMKKIVSLYKDGGETWGCTQSP